MSIILNPVSRLFRLPSPTHHAIIFIHGTQFAKGIGSETPYHAARWFSFSEPLGGYLQAAALEEPLLLFLYLPDMPPQNLKQPNIHVIINIHPLILFSS